jgi:hypothetical protein
MTVAVTTLRSTVATVLSNPGVWQVFDHIPATLLPNSVYISWDDPMLEPSNNDFNTVGPSANFKITMVLPLFDNLGNLNGIEDMLVGVFNKFANDETLHIKIGNVSTPSVLSAGAAEMLVSEMAISLITSWS